LFKQLNIILTASAWRRIAAAAWLILIASNTNNSLGQVLRLAPSGNNAKHTFSRLQLAQRLQHTAAF
jgi:hypothetical protein